MGGVVAHEILVTAQSPNSPFPFWICLFGFGAWALDRDFDSGLSIRLLEKQNVTLSRVTNHKCVNTVLMIPRLKIQFPRHIATGDTRRDGNGARVQDCVKFPSGLL